MDKAELKYKVIAGKNPRTGQTLLRPVIIGRPSMSLRSLVDYARTANYVRGQTKDLEGLLGGFIQAMQDRAKAGYSINVNDWFIIGGRLKGSVDGTGTLTAKNSYHVTITASKDLKVDFDNFSWTNVGNDGKSMKVESITSPNGKKDQVIDTKDIVANGKGLSFDAARGDSVTVSWKEAEETKSLSLEPTEQSETYLRFAWPEGLSGVAEGTVLSFVFTLHGSSDGADRISAREATLVAAE